MIILGVDPGLSGALALLDCEARRRPRLVSTIDMPVVGEDARRRVWIAPLTEWLIENPKPEVAFVERAQAFPEQNASSGFLYGRAVGYVEAAILCCGVRLRTAEPSVWKRQMGLARKPEDKTKTNLKAASLALARAAFDDVGERLSLAKHENRAEAMLIGAFGARQMDVAVTMPAPELQLTG